MEVEPLIEFIVRRGVWKGPCLENDLYQFRKEVLDHLDQLGVLFANIRVRVGRILVRHCM